MVGAAMAAEADAGAAAGAAAARAGAPRYDVLGLAAFHAW